MSDVEDFLDRQGELVVNLTTIALAKADNDRCRDRHLVDAEGHRARAIVLSDRTRQLVEEYDASIAGSRQLRCIQRRARLKHFVDLEKKRPK